MLLVRIDLTLIDVQDVIILVVFIYLFLASEYCRLEKNNQNVKWKWESELSRIENASRNKWINSLNYQAKWRPFDCLVLSSPPYFISGSCFNATFVFIDSRALALSVLMNTGQVVHYKIHFNPSQENCFIYPAQPFDTIEDLIVHYMGENLTEHLTEKKVALALNYLILTF